MDGIFVNGYRPKSKREVREACQTNPESVEVERTRFGHERIETLDQITSDVHFVGPDPYNDRKFYGTIRWDSKKAKYVVK